MMDCLWEGLLESPIKGRISKPRSYGITMLIDKGLSLSETNSLLEMNNCYVDFIKLTFGTTALYPPAILNKKIKMVEDFGVNLYPGGTFYEIAHWQGKTSEYFAKLVEIGFKWVEISDGTLEIPTTERKRTIKEAQTAGLQVITEVGKKDSCNQPDDCYLVNNALRDLESGAIWVIIEARESGQGIGIYDSKGKIITEKLNRLSQSLPLEKVIWEAPLKSQQAQLINDFGPNVNLGNIPPSEIMPLEALRLGYRNDTWNPNAHFNSEVSFI